MGGVGSATEVNISGSNSNELREFLTDSYSNTKNSFGDKSKNSLKRSSSSGGNLDQAIKFQIKTNNYIGPAATGIAVSEASY